MMDAMFHLPRRFIEDHRERKLPTPALVKVAGKYAVRADDPNLPELLDDAQHYASPDSPDMLPPGLKNAAIQLVRSITRQRGY